MGKTESKPGERQDLHPHPSHQQTPPQSHGTKSVFPHGSGTALTLLVLVTGYCIFLIFGTFVHTQRLDKLFADGTFRSRDVVTMVICWTWTNLLILCCLSAAIGEVGRVALLDSQELPNIKSAIVRGFFILLLTMTGQLVVLGTPAATELTPEIIRKGMKEPATQDPEMINRGMEDTTTNNDMLDDLHAHICLRHFFRIAAVASLFAFIVGMDPQLFSKLIMYFEKMKVRK